MNISQVVRIIFKLSSQKQIYLVGGAIRDILLDKEVYDIDLTLSKNPLSVAKKLTHIIKGSFVTLDDVNKIYRVIKKTNKATYTFDFTKLKGKTVSEDLSNRDITINAMAVRLKDIVQHLKGDVLKLPDESIIIDPYGGLCDLKNKTVKLISENSILNDPVRMLRVYRFSASLNFKIDSTTKKIVKKNTSLITLASYERIRDEFFKILATPHSVFYILQLDKIGLLTKIFPEIILLKKSARKFYFHPQGLWHHLTETLLSLEDVLSNLKKYFSKTHKSLTEYLNENISSSSRLTLLKYITILHDIGKPRCVRKIKGRVRFFGHEVVGTKLFEEISRRLKLSNNEINIGKNLIKNHMRILQLVGGQTITERATFRLMRDVGDDILSLAILSLSDAMSYRKLPGFEKNNIKDILRYVRKLVQLYFDRKNQQPRKKIIDGHILMKELNLKPGPIIGKLLTAIDEEYNLKRISTTQEAIAFAKVQIRKYKHEIISSAPETKQIFLKHFSKKL